LQGSSYFSSLSSSTRIVNNGVSLSYQRLRTETSKYSDVDIY
jgi:hypothetical protein